MRRPLRPARARPPSAAPRTTAQLLALLGREHRVDTLTRLELGLEHLLVRLRHRGVDFARRVVVRFAGFVLLLVQLAHDLPLLARDLAPDVGDLLALGIGEIERSRAPAAARTHAVAGTTHHPRPHTIATHHSGTHAVAGTIAAHHPRTHPVTGAIAAHHPRAHAVSGAVPTHHPRTHTVTGTIAAHHPGTHAVSGTRGAWLGPCGGNGQRRSSRDS